MTLNPIKGMLLFCFLGLSLNLNAQASLEIEVLTCNGLRGSEVYLNNIELYQNNSLIKVFNSSDFNAPIKNLKPGQYQINYTSIFGKKNSVSFELQPKSKKELILCADYIEHEKEDYIPFIDQIQNKESYSIALFSRGCFHFSKDTLSISKVDDLFYITYQGNKKRLEKEDIEELRFFEIELNALSIGGTCTSSVYYQLTYKDVVIGKTDDSCQWNGLYFFMEKMKQSD